MTRGRSGRAVPSLSLREAVGGRDDALGHLIATGATGTDKVELGVRPRPRELPRGDRRAAEVEATVDQDARNPDQTVRFA
ncbi:MAG TPA: hypothetical protein VEQ37_09060 [Actinomycetota bacterium]|nr:hypothetical protein [Actinomycetota bacterium]